MNADQANPAGYKTRLAVGFLLFGLSLYILGNEWPAPVLGLPLMMLGMAMPLVSRFTARSQQDRQAMAAREAQRAERHGGNSVYEIHSSRYKSAARR